MHRVSKFLSFLPVLVMAAMLVAGLSACSGQRARTNVLAPAILLGAEGLQGDVAAGIATLPGGDRADATATASRFFAAVETGERTTILVSAIPVWPVVQQWANDGIDAKLAANEIGPNGAESLRERVRNWNEGLAKTVQGIDQPD